MRAGWNKATLGTLCKIYQPQTLTLKELDPNGIYDVFGANGVIGKHSQYNHENCELLMGCRGSCGALNFSSPFAWINGNAMVIHPIKEIVSKEYLRYYLESIDKHLIISGTTIPQITAKSLSPLIIDYPSTTEQQRIVGILDQEFARIDALKANAEKSLHAAKDLFQAALRKELEPKEGWSNTRMDEICHITAELIDPTQPEYLHQIHIGGANIEAETGVLLDLKTAEEEKLISGKFPFDETMVLYSKIRPYLKKICCPTFQGICSADIYPLTPLPGIDRTFLYYILLSQDFTDYAILGSARAGMPKVNRPYLFAYTCAIPEYKEQCAIGNRLNTIREKAISLQNNYQKTLTLCDDLKQALLRKAFNGKL